MGTWYRWTYTSVNPYSFHARCRVYDANDTLRQGWTTLKTPVIDLASPAGPESLFFWYRFSQSANNLGPDDTMFVDISNDDMNWSTCFKLGPGDDTNTWQIARIDLFPFDTFATARIRFHYVDEPNGQLGTANANFWLDSVKVISPFADTIPPGLVNDLAFRQIGSDHVNMQWTAPGDDGYAGQASFYDLRYATFAITEANFYSALETFNEPFPSPAGQIDSCLITDLSSNTLYYFALKTADEDSNWSFISNVPSCTTQTQIDSILPISVAFQDLDSNYVPDLLDSVVSITGVITAPPGTFSDNEAYIQDSSGGVNMYGDFPVALDYRDSIVITGTVDQYRGKSEITNFVYTLQSSNATLPDPIMINGATMNTEKYEGMLVSVPVEYFDGFLLEGDHNYDAYDTLNTPFVVRIDGNTNIPGTIAPIDTFIITGIKGQYSYSTPPDDGYQLLPRDTTDFSHLFDMPQIKTIAEVQSPGNDGVSSKYLDSLVAVEGVVTGPNYVFTSGSPSFYIQDSTSGINIYDADGDSAFTTYIDSLGARMCLVGTVTEYNGLTEIAHGYGWFLNMDTVPAARDLPRSVFLTESMEGILIKFSGVIKTAPYRTGDGYNMDVLNGDAGLTVRFTAGSGINPVYIHKNEQRLITGIVGQYDHEEPYTSGYQVLLRFPDDITLPGEDSASAEPLISLEGNKTFIPSIGEQAIIRINSPIDYRLDLKIYDMAYRTVRCLYNGAGGPQVLYWDGRDEYARPCPLGIYLLNLKAIRSDGKASFERLLVVIGAQ
jgi:hypothetical protein